MAFRECDSPDDTELSFSSDGSEGEYPPGFEQPYPLVEPRPRLINSVSTQCIISNSPDTLFRYPNVHVGKRKDIDQREW